MVKTLNDVREALSQVGVKIGVGHDSIEPFTREGNSIFDGVVPDPVDGKYILILDIANPAFMDCQSLLKRSGLDTYFYGYMVDVRIAVIG